MGNHLPFRLPCGGVGVPTCGQGPLFKHSSPANVAIAVYDTTVEGVAPTPRFLAGDGGDSCVSFNCDPETDDCRPWTGPDAVYNLASPPPTPHFSLNGALQDFSFCRQRGFKNVIAGRYWHGILPFTANEYQAYTAVTWPNPEGDPGAGTPTCFLREQLGSPTQKKFTRLHLEARWLADNSACPDDTDAVDTALTAEVRVDPLTGVRYPVSWSNPDSTDPLPFADSAIGDALGWAAENLKTVVDRFLVATQSGTVSRSGNTWTVRKPGSYGGNSYEDLIYEIITNDFSGSMSREIYGPIDRGCYSGDGYEPDGTAWGIIESESVSITESSLEYTHIWNTTDPDGNPSDWSARFEVAVTLSDVNTAASIQDDLDFLLGKWPLNDDKLYPWRTGGQIQFGPLVTRNEVPGDISPLTALSEDFTDDNAGIRNGAIIGIPNDAGKQGAFDFYYDDWRACRDVDTGSTLWYLFQSGQKNTGQGGLPLNATHWTNYLQCAALPGCAVTQHNTGAFNPNPHSNPGSVTKMKIAYILEPWPSYDFTRPCGADKFKFEEGAGVVQSVFCVDSIDGSDVNLAFTDGTPVDFTPDAGIYGGSDVGGFFNCTFSTGVAHLGTKVFDLPTGWDVGGFGKLRFPTAPGILGRVAVSALTDDSPVHLTLPYSPYLAKNLITPETVDLCAADMTVLASAVAITRVSDTEFTVPTAYATIANAKWIVAHGAPAWYMSDRDPKGDYVYTENHFAYRDYSETNRVATDYAACIDGCDCSVLAGVTGLTTPLQEIVVVADCLQFCRRTPAVVCISPNVTDQFENGVTHSLPHIDLDVLFGARWQAEVHQTMNDPLWQSDHVPCAHVGAWNVDDGSCNPDGNHYAHPRQVEARVTVPTYGFSQTEAGPALPSGIYINLISHAAYLAGATGNVLLPVEPQFNLLDGSPAAYPTPWGFAIAAEACVCGGGVFGVSYSADGIRCWET